MTTYPTVEKHRALLVSTDFGDLLEKGITMPADEKANDIRVNCEQIKDDAAQFEKFNIDWRAIVAEMLEGAQLLIDTEAILTTYSNVNETAQELWSEYKPALYNWRKESFARLTYHNFLNPDADLTRSLNRISEGSGPVDTLQDVYQTFGLIDMHREGLSKNGLTVEAVDEARRVYDITAKAYPEALTTEGELAEAKELRDRAFWYLVSLEKRLKEGHLPFVFFDDYDRRREYGSSYTRKVKLNSNKS